MSEEKQVTSYVVITRVKDYVKGKGMRSDGDLDTALNKLIESLLDRAAERCKENGRSTVRPSDL